MFYRRECWFFGNRRDDWKRNVTVVDVYDMVIEEPSRNLVVVFSCWIFLFFWFGPAVPTTAISGVDVAVGLKVKILLLVSLVLTVGSTATNDGDSWR